MQLQLDMRSLAFTGDCVSKGFKKQKKELVHALIYKGTIDL